MNAPDPPVERRRSHRCAASLRAWLWGIVAVLSIAAGFAWDETVRQALNQPPHSELKHLAGEISTYTRLEFELIPPMALMAWGAWRRRKELARAGLCVALATTLAGVVGMTIRGVTGRTRPSADAPQGWYGVWHEGQVLIGRSDFNSFPSGHVSTAAGFAAAVFLLHRRWGWVAFLLPAGVAWARMNLDRHHFSDVIPACVVGGLAAWVVCHEWMAPGGKVRAWFEAGWARFSDGKD